MENKNIGIVGLDPIEKTKMIDLQKVHSSSQADYYLAKAINEIIDRVNLLSKMVEEFKLKGTK